MFDQAHQPRQQQQQQQQQQGAELPSATTRVLFSCCKGETHTHRSGFKQLFRRLRAAYRPEKLDAADDLHPEVLLGAGGAAPAVLVLGCPTERFSASECGAITQLVTGGGGLLVLLGEGGEAAGGTNINYILEQFGIAANPDAVLRTSHYKYMHPKEALVVDGVLNRSVLMGTAAAGTGGSSSSSKQAAAFASRDGLQFVYPFGCTLSVQRPAVAVLSSGKICYPMQRPLAAAWEAQPGSGGGRLLVLGAAQAFDDQWLDKEDNARLMDWVFKWLRPVSLRVWGSDVSGWAMQLITLLQRLPSCPPPFTSPSHPVHKHTAQGSRLALHPGDAEEPDLSDARLLPDTEALADRPKPCLQEVRPLPRDFTRLFDRGLYGLDTALVPEAVLLYSQLGVRKAPLALIAPSFETPLPPLTAATFPPVAREPPPPALELFDLDDAFASTQSRLAAIFNKSLTVDTGSTSSSTQQQRQRGQQGGVEATSSSGVDLEYFLLEAGAACGLDKRPEEGAKGVLSELLRQLLCCRTVGAVGGGVGGGTGPVGDMPGGSGSQGGSPAVRRLTGSGLGNSMSSSRGGLGSAGSGGGAFGF